VAQGQLPEVPHDAEEGISLKGRLIGPAGKPLNRHIIMASVLKDERAFRKDFTEEDGSFNFGGFDFDNDIEVVFQHYRGIENIAGKVRLDSVQVPEVLQRTLNQPLAAGPVLTNYITKSSLRRRITEALGESAPDTSNQIQVAVSAGVSSARRAIYNDYVPDETILIDRFISFPTITELIKELVPGIQVSQRKGVWRFRVLNRQTKMYYKGEPFYIIDKVPVYDKEQLVNLDPATIQSIELIAQPGKLASFGQLGFNGVIIVNTKNNDFYPYEVNDAIKLRVSGYDPPRPFYLPTYDGPMSPSKMPDLRPLLYWNPGLQTDASGRATLTFYNSDDATTFWVLAEGLAPDGRPGTGTYEYEVKVRQ
jgi:hypothetical protein